MVSEKIETPSIGHMEENGSVAGKGEDKCKCRFSASDEVETWTWTDGVVDDRQR